MLINTNILAGLVSTLFGLVYTLLALNIPPATVGDPVAPSIFPIMVGIALFLIGLLMMFQEIRKQRAGQGTTNSIEFKFHGFRAIRYENKMIFITVLCSLFYAFTFNSLGYIIATFIFLGVLLFALNGLKKWKSNLIITLIFSVAVYFIFTKLLAIPLPTSPFLNY
ncbi:MAG: Tripartite tricarboxylate transporter TctB family protein [Oscillospiraceae bacterium]